MLTTNCTNGVVKNVNLLILHKPQLKSESNVLFLHAINCCVLSISIYNLLPKYVIFFLNNECNTYTKLTNYRNVINTNMRHTKIFIYFIISLHAAYDNVSKHAFATVLIFLCWGQISILLILTFRIFL